MIRDRREKGSLRTAVILAGLILLAASAAAPSPARRGTPKWWEIRLTVAAKGTYAVRGGEAPVSGEYTVKARYEGRINPDDDDFLLVLLKTETPEWSLREKTGLGKAERAVEAPALPPPVLRLNYILRDKDEIEIDFAFEGGTVPIGAPALGIPLELPCSNCGPAGRPGYIDDVLDGSNRIVLPVSDLDRGRPARTFAWEWTGTRLVSAGSRSYVTTQSHSAEAVVVLIGH
jgi:hypothetical protein